MTRLSDPEQAVVTAAMDLLTARARWHAGEQAALAEFLGFSVPGPPLFSLDDMPMSGFGFACRMVQELLAIVERLDAGEPGP